MENLLKDLKYGARVLVKSPAFSLIAVLSLALGIGANTAIFSLVSTLMFSPFPAERPAELVSIFTTDQRNPGNLPISHLNFKDYRDQNGSFTGVAAFAFGQMNMHADGSSEQILAQVVSGNYYTVTQRTREIGVRMALGARQSDVVALILRQGMWLVFGGLVAGLALSAALAPAIGSLLVGVAPLDPVTLIATAAVLALVAGLATWVPARRAAAIDPLIALRYE